FTISKSVTSCSISFFVEAEGGIRGRNVTGVQTCALPISDCAPASMKLSRIGAGEKGTSGLMVESFLEAGAQSVEAEPLVYGQSVTDACIGWDTTADSLRSLAEAVRRSRGVTSR